MTGFFRANRHTMTRPTGLPSSRSWTANFLFMTVAMAPWAAAQEPSPRPKGLESRTGEQVYRQHCIRCHGEAGRGTKDNYPRALVGDKSLTQLTKVIDETMPEDDPELCVGEDAAKVAQYINDAFYSRLAQERNRPARVELSRLTVNQYRNTIADLIGSFRWEGDWDQKQGLKAEYYKSRRFRNGERTIERIDPVVRFDFKEGSPDPSKMEPKEYAIRWQGSVLAPDTGEYEFIARTQNGAKLWINDSNKPLIDAGVQSGSQTEYSGTIHLLGGRRFRLRLEFFKTREKVGSVSLEWKRPQRPQEVIDSRYLSPNSFPEIFVATTPFPPDDRSVGYERGNSISKEWEQAATAASIEVASYLLPRLGELADAKPELDPAEREKRLRKFCESFAQRAFRHPLDDETRKLYIDRVFSEAKSPELAVRRVLLLVLNSPRFLYREPGEPEHGPFTIASRLSYTLWDSMPDKKLIEAASSGRLKTLEQVREQATRMVDSPRARVKLKSFFLQWLKVDQVPDIAKDPKVYAEFTPALASDLRTSLELFLDGVINGADPDFRKLLQTEELYLNGALARLYGADLPADAAFQPVKLKVGERAGLLSHPYLMANFAYTATSSPIHRGVFLSRALLGRTLRPPPEAVAPLAPDLEPSLTTRERVVLQTSPAACQTCHAMINPLGFSLENYDAIGRYRLDEKSKPVDSSGSYLSRSGSVVKFKGVRELAAFLSRAEETQNAFVEQLFQGLVKQPILAYGSQMLADLRQSFVEQNYNMRDLMVEIAVRSAWLNSPTLTARSSR